MYTITLCCSKKFKKEERDFARRLRKLGMTVYEPPLYASKRWDALSEEEKLALAAGFTLRHFEKIKKSDAIFVLNVGGYMGISTTLEIGYAAGLNKRIFFLENDEDYPRKILAENVIRTPEELLKRLHDGKTADVLD